MTDKQSNIPAYSPADLLRYATGRMTSTEMHAMEKAALEDPFLEEALEGYREVLATQLETEVKEQANRLTVPDQKQKARVVPLWQRKSVRVAVAALFIGGAGWAIFSLLQKPALPSVTIAQQAPAQPTQPDTGAATNATIAAAKPGLQTPLADSATPSLGLVAKEDEVARQMVPAAAPPSGTIAAQPVNQPAKDFAVVTFPNNQQRPGDKKAADTMLPTANGRADATAMLEMSEPRKAMRSMQAPVHIFKVRITDVRNNPIPYANVMIEGQDIGTYSDVTGYFNFVSDDSILPIRVRSVGYTNQAIALHDGRLETKIVLQEDQQLNNSLPLTVQTKKKPEAGAAKSIVERDSLVGMEASNINVPYYDLYLLNNNRISPLPNLRRQVQLSFDVSKNGEATNITVVRSSGKVLDQEAIRLVKEGPKLVGDSSSRKKVTVRF